MTDAEIAQLKEWLRQLKWKSVDRDNMEFEVRTTCWVKDALDKFALTPMRAKNKLMREALESIAKNTCCGPCQEAALVARKALND